MIRTILRSTAAVALLATAAQAQVFNTAAPTTGSIATPNTETSASYANLSLAWNIT